MENEILLCFWKFNKTFLFDIFNIITSKAYVLVTSLMFIVYGSVRLKKRAVPFIITIIAAVSLSDALCYRVLKPSFERLRPKIELKISELNHQPGPNDFSMPSNHASNIFSFFAVYFMYIKRFRIPALINSILVAFSRVFLIKHYPTDVLAGILIGVLIGFICGYISIKIYNLKVLREEKPV